MSASKRQVVVFEDRAWRGLYPITLSRPAFDCRAGGTTLGRRLLAQLAERDLKHVTFLTRSLLRPLVEREYLGHAVNQNHAADTLFLNGRLLCLGDSLDRLLELMEKSVAVKVGDELAAVRLTGSAAKTYGLELMEALEAGDPVPAPVQQTVGDSSKDLRLVRHAWDLVSWTSEIIEDDFNWAKSHPHHSAPETSPGSLLLRKEHIRVREGVCLEPGAVLDARSGPILLGEHVHIEHGAVVLGPAYLGPHTRVKMGARIYDGVSAGPQCRLGGEIEAAVFQGYANKQHDGFLGHAYLGAWTNLGAATNNSDLKNNYRPVSVWTPDGEIDTGLLFAGLFMGDHSKTAIGTRFNTGTVVGFSCNLFGSGFPPRRVPSFTWAGDDGASAYRLDAALDVAGRVMARRNQRLEPADEVLFRHILDTDGAQGSR